MLKKIALGIVAVLALVLIYAAFQPDHYRVTRSATIKAPPDKIMPLISDFHNWPIWSPWEKLDPSMHRNYSGAARELGAVYAWDGNDKVGAGRMEITGLSAARADIKLDFLKPFESHNQTEFLLEPKGDATVVTWVMSGPADYMTKLMSIAASMDSMIGKDFESGLANLKAAAEK
ncbi:SRPBCC family protein [Oxalobacteraceae bacterium]|nr:SRPBCC family protein [Oxalobacteraceae bacterium]